MGACEKTIRERQRPLRRHYRRSPGAAWVTDRAATATAPGADATRGLLVFDDHAADRWRFGVHRAVGGDHDAPNPGDLLCGALAACQDATLRMLADRLAIGLEWATVKVSAQVDVRGALAIDRRVPVGFQRMSCRVYLKVSEGTNPGQVERLCLAAERSCVVLQTLRHAVDVRVQFDVSH